MSKTFTSLDYSKIKSKIDKKLKLDGNLNFTTVKSKGLYGLRRRRISFTSR